MLIFHSHSMANLIYFRAKNSEIAQTSIFRFWWSVKKANGECMVFIPYYSRFGDFSWYRKKTWFFKNASAETSFLCLQEMLIFLSHSMSNLRHFSAKSSIFMFWLSVKNANGECMVFNPYYSRQAKLRLAIRFDRILQSRSNKISWFMKGPQYYKKYW